jgi:hypothetical protein
LYQVDRNLWQSGALTHVPPGIDCVVNLAMGDEPAFRHPAGSFVGYLHAPVSDGPFRGLPWLRSVVAAVNGWRRNGWAVLVHCAAGVSRSSLVTCACLMEDRRLSAADALALVRAQHPQAQPNPNFLRALREYETSLGIGSPDPFSWVAPLGTADRPLSFRGRREGKYRVTAAIPHLNSPESLRLVVGLLRLQTEPPYLLVVDTGSPPAVCEQLERLRGPDLEVHYVRAHGYNHTSAPVTAAMDLAWSLTRTEYSFATHTDCFPVRRDLLAWLLGRCGPEVPVVGWQMSPRPGTEGWRTTPSHTCSLYHLPTLRRAGCSWNMERWYDDHDPSEGSETWPDTESVLGECLERAGLGVELLGPEPNLERHLATASFAGDDRTVWFDHPRSQTYFQTYCWQGTHHRRVLAYADPAVEEARVRLAEWEKG